MVSKPVWFCRGMHIEGYFVICVDQVTDGELAGYRRVLDQLQLDNAINPRAMFRMVIAEMTRTMERLVDHAQPAPDALGK